MKKTIYLMAIALFTLGTTMSCRDEKSTGEKVEDAFEEVGDDIEDGVDEVEDEVKDATDDN